MEIGFVKALITAFTANNLQQALAAELQEDRADLMAMVKQAEAELQNADRGFDEAADKDLAEYYIYYRKAAEAKYNYLIKTVKGKTRAQASNGLFASADNTIES